MASLSGGQSGASGIVDKIPEFIPKLLQGAFKTDKFGQQMFVFGENAVACRFQQHFAFVQFDGLLEVVNVSELNVELVLKMFDLCEVVFCEGLPAHLGEGLFAIMEFFSVIAKNLPPVCAFGRKLRDVC
jgi:hypothetical protein